MSLKRFRGWEAIEICCGGGGGEGWGVGMGGCIKFHANTIYMSILKCGSRSMNVSPFKVSYPLEYTLSILCIDIERDGIFENKNPCAVNWKTDWIICENQNVFDLYLYPFDFVFAGRAERKEGLFFRYDLKCFITSCSSRHFIRCCVIYCEGGVEACLSVLSPAPSPF